MYEKLIAELREYWNDGTEDLRNQAADAIEELQKALDAVNDAHNEGFDVGYWAGRRDYEQKWIPITERLPDDRTEVVAVCKGGAYDQLQWVALLYFCNEPDGAKFQGIDKAITNARVTHWMPLPPPPQEGKQDG